MSTQPVGGTVESGGYTVTSTHETAEQMTAGLAEPGTTEPETEPDPSKAAAVLGKKGGEAAAAKRAAEAKEKARAEKRARGAAAPDEGDGSGDAGEPGEAAVADGATQPSEAEKTAAEERRKGNPRHDPTARVAQATREAREAREEAARAREEAARYRAELEAARRPAGSEQERPQRREAPGAPKVEDFESYEEFVEAKIEHRLQQERQEAARQHQAQERDHHQRAYESRFMQSVAKAAGAEKLQGQAFLDKIAEFHAGILSEILEATPTFRLKRGDPAPDGRTWIADELVDNAEHAPALMLHLSEHPDEYQRIAALQSPRAVTREMAKIVTSLEAETTDTSSKPTVSKAKPPVRPVTGSPYTAGEPDPDASSYDEHKAFYNARDRARR